MKQPAFSDKDVALLCKVAAGHLHFGHFETSRRLLHLAIWLDGTHAEAFTLLAHAALRDRCIEDFHMAMRSLKANAHEIPADLGGALERMPDHLRPV